MSSGKAASIGSGEAKCIGRKIPNNRPCRT
jgi:hypothetical protein